MRKYDILGVMSGSSLDALDLALVRFEVNHTGITAWDLVECFAFPLPDTWKRRLTEGIGDLHDHYRLHHEFGQLIGEVCADFIDRTGLKPEAISSHGHTVLHYPEHGYTVQIGHPADIALRTQCMVITDFRSKDIAAGGLGAPLAPVVEKYCFPGYHFYLNLGGIANLSYLTPDQRVLAWDICPCNQLLNYVAGDLKKGYDDRGLLAAQGVVSEPLLRELHNRYPLPLRQPSTLDNTWIRTHYFPLLDTDSMRQADILATLCIYIAQCVRIQLTSNDALSPGSRLLITGGGAHHDFLVQCIREEVAPAEIVIPEVRMVDFKEAILMAVCGVLRLLGKPNAFCSVTGASHDTVNGCITHP